MILPALLFSLLPQDAPKPVDPAVAFERAKIAEEIGDLAAAEAWLRRAAEAADAAVAASARSRLENIRARLGRGVPQDAPAARASSPVERRVLEAIELLKTSPGSEEAIRKEIAWIGEAAIPVISSIIEAPEIPSFLRDVLLGAAADIGGGGALGLLEKIANSKDHLLRRKAVGLLGKRDLSVAFDRWAAVLAGYLGDEDAGVRRAALGHLRDVPDVVRPRADALARDPDPEVRAEIVRNHAALLTPESLDVLVHDPVTSVRLEVARRQGIRSPAWTDPVAVLLLLVDDPEARIRTMAINVLPGLPIETGTRGRVFTELEARIDDPSSQVREALARNALDILQEEGVSILLRLAPDPEVGSRAIQGLSSTTQHHWRRSDLALAVATAIELAPRFREQTDVGNYGQFLQWMVDHAALPEDFPMCARVLVEVPELNQQGGIVTSILKRARREDVSTLCAVWGSVAPYTRRVILSRLGELLAGEEGPIPSCALEVLRSALAPAEDKDTRYEALQAAVRARAVGLTDEIVAALALGDTPGGRAATRLVESMQGFAKAYPSEGAHILVETARRFGLVILGTAGPSPLEGLRRCFSDDALVAALAEFYGSSPSPSERREALQSLPRGNEGATRFLVDKGFGDPSAEVRASTIYALSTRGAFEPQVTEAVRKLASDPDGSVRQGVATYCARWNAPEAVPVARGLMGDPEWSVRLSAVKALGSLLSQDAVADLIEALADENQLVRDAAKEALERIRFYHEEKKRWDDWYAGRGADPGEGVRKLLEALDDPSLEVRCAAIESLGTMRAKEALPRLVALLKNPPTPEEKAAAARALARINREE